MFACEQSACPSETCGNLIKNDQYPPFPAQPCRLHKILRMVKPHSSCSLDYRFENQGGYFVSMLFNNLLQRFNVPGIPCPVKTAARLWHKMSDWQSSAENAVHPRNRIADRHRIPGVPMISRADRNEICPRSKPFGILILDSHLHGYFHSYRTAVCIEYMREL